MSNSGNTTDFLYRAVNTGSRGKGPGASSFGRPPRQITRNLGGGKQVRIDINPNRRGTHILSSPQHRDLALVELSQGASKQKVQESRTYALDIK